MLPFPVFILQRHKSELENENWVESGPSNQFYYARKNRPEKQVSPSILFVCLNLFQTFLWRFMEILTAYFSSLEGIWVPCSMCSIQLKMVKIPRRQPDLVSDPLNRGENIQYRVWRSLPAAHLRPERSSLRFLDAGKANKNKPPYARSLALFTEQHAWHIYWAPIPGWVHVGSTCCVPGQKNFPPSSNNTCCPRTTAHCPFYYIPNQVAIYWPRLFTASAMQILFRAPLIKANAATAVYNS